MSAKASVLVLLVFIAFLTGCTADPGETLPRTDATAVVDEAIFVRDSAGNEAVLKYLDSAAANAAFNFRTKFDIYGFRHGHFLLLKDLPKAMLYADSMLYLVDVNDSYNWDASLLANAYNAKADVYYEEGNYKLAFFWYDKAKRLSDLKLNTCLQGAYMFRIAMSLYKQERYEEAASSFSQCYRLTKNCDTNLAQWVRWQEVLGNAGLSFYKSGRPDSALDYYRQALNTIEAARITAPKNRITYDEAASVIYGNIGSVYMDKGLQDSAGLFLKLSLQLNRASGKNATDRLFTMLKLGELYLADNHPEMSVTYIQPVRTAVDNGLQDKEVVRRLEKTQYEYYHLTGNDREAFLHLKKYNGLNDTLAMLSKKALLSDIREGLHRQETTNTISVLEQKEKIRRLTIQVLVLVTVLGIIVILAGTWFILYQRRNIKEHKKINEHISLRSEKNEKKLQEKIRQSEINLRALIDNTDDLIWSIDRKMNLISFNLAYEHRIVRLLGTHSASDATEIIAVSGEAAFHHALKEHYAAAFAGKEIEFVEKGTDELQGESFLEYRFRPIHQADGSITGVSCFCTDITQALKTVRQIQMQKDKLKEIAWIQSHKVRGPVATIKGLMLLLNKEHPGDPANKQLLEMMEKTVEELDRVIHEITSQATKEQ